MALLSVAGWLAVRSLCSLAHPPSRPSPYVVLAAPGWVGELVALLQRLETGEMPPGGILCLLGPSGAPVWASSVRGGGAAAGLCQC